MSRGCSQGWTLMKYLSPGNQREQRARWGMGTGRAERGLRARSRARILWDIWVTCFYTQRPNVIITI